MASAVAKILDDLRDRGGLKGADLANIASVSPATVSRWTSGKALPHPRTQLVISDLRYVVDRLAEFYSPDETRIWAYSRHPLLNGERAIDLIHAGRTDEALEPECWRVRGLLYEPGTRRRARSDWISALVGAGLAEPHRA